MENYDLTRCPVRYYGITEVYWLQAYSEYKNGYLPNDGGWLDQPAKFSEMMMTIETLMKYYQEQEEKTDGRPKSKYTPKAQR